VPLEKDEKALPALDEIEELEAEVKILIDALNLQSASGVVVSAN
jgi:HAMP domain-containing protein